MGRQQKYPEANDLIAAHLVPMHAIPGGFLKIITTEIYGRRGSRSVRLATPSVCQAVDVEN